MVCVDPDSSDGFQSAAAACRSAAPNAVVCGCNSKNGGGWRNTSASWNVECLWNRIGARRWNGTLEVKTMATTTAEEYSQSVQSRALTHPRTTCQFAASLGGEYGSPMEPSSRFRVAAGNAEVMPGRVWRAGAGKWVEKCGDFRREELQTELGLRKHATPKALPSKPASTTHEHKH